MKLLWKLSLGYGLLVLLTTAVVGALVLRRGEALAEQALEESLLHRATILGALVRDRLAAPDAELQARVRALGERTDTRYTVIRADGLVLAESATTPEALDNHRNRPEVIEARRAGRGSARRRSHSVGEALIYVAVALPAEAGAEPAGYARAGAPLASVQREVAELRQAVLYGAAFGLLLALVPCYAFARYVTGPLERMADAARGIARGDYGPRLPARTHDELGRLADAMNTMAAQLRERMETITTDQAKVVAILASMVEGVVAVDRDERVVHLNAVAARLLDVDPAQSIGRHIWEVTRVREVSDALSRTLARPRQATVEVRLPRVRPGDPSGDPCLELHAAPLRGADGTLAGALVVIHDVTRLRRLERVRRDFMGNVSHELKTPLTAIRGLVETLIEDGGMDAAQRRDFLARCEAQVERLNALVQDLLVLSRVESEEAALSLEPIDLRAPAETSARSLRAVAEEKRLDLRVTLPGDPVLVLGDRELLRQVVDNLLSNAIRYTDEGGRVDLRVRAAGEDAWVEVQDTGIGIPAREQARIFERFYRVDKARSRRLGGTGLGLAIVKHITLSHHGEVSVESTPGEGSAFRVRLPLAGSEASSARGGERVETDARARDGRP